MHFIDFRNLLADYPVFSLQDIRKTVGNSSYRQLDRWEKKGYIKKIRRGFYCFEDQKLDQDFLFYTANKIYAPSYISLEMALSFYDFIPEGVFQVTSVSAKKTTSFYTPIGNFSYRRVTPRLFWGYDLMNFGRQKILLADPEKALLDYLYLNPQLKKASDFIEMRLNVDEFKAKINMKKFNRYIKVFKNRALARRAKIFLTAIQHDNA